MIITVEFAIERIHRQMEILRKLIKGVKRGYAIAAEYPGKTGHSYPQDFGYLFPVHFDWLCCLIHHTTNYTALMPNCQMDRM